MHADIIQRRSFHFSHLLNRDSLKKRSKIAFTFYFAHLVACYYGNFMSCWHKLFSEHLYYTVESLMTRVVTLDAAVGGREKSINSG